MSDESVPLALRKSPRGNTGVASWVDPTQRSSPGPAASSQGTNRETERRKVSPRRYSGTSSTSMETRDAYSPVSSVDDVCEEAPPSGGLTRKSSPSLADSPSVPGDRTPPLKRRKSSRAQSQIQGLVQEDDKNDCYCWLCHKEGSVVCCELCPRVYHLKCLNIEGELSEDWLCPECRKIMQAECLDTRSKAMSMLTLDQFSQLLKFSLQRMKHQGSEPFQQPVSLASIPSYTDYIFHPMDLSLMERNVRRKMYGSTEAFLADSKWIQHNCTIFNGLHHKLTNSAKLIVKICKHEMTEIEICPDCYLNSCFKKDTSWFNEPCRKPHPLVWAKMKGYPFWPSKALQEKNDQIDVRFFGAHDRAWVPCNQIYMLSKECPTPMRNRKGGFDEAMDELNDHIRRIKENFGTFEYAPFRTPYDKKHAYKHNRIKPLAIKKEPEQETTPADITENKPKPQEVPEITEEKTGKDRKACTLTKIAEIIKSPGGRTLSVAAKTASAVKNKYNSIITTKKVAKFPKVQTQITISNPHQSTRKVETQITINLLTPSKESSEEKGENVKNKPLATDDDKDGNKEEKLPLPGREVKSEADLEDVLPRDTQKLEEDSDNEQDFGEVSPDDIKSSSGIDSITEPSEQETGTENTTTENKSEVEGNRVAEDEENKAIESMSVNNPDDLPRLAQNPSNKSDSFFKTLMKTIEDCKSKLGVDEDEVECVVEPDDSEDHSEESGSMSEAEAEDEVDMNDNTGQSSSPDASAPASPTEEMLLDSSQVHDESAMVNDNKYDDDRKPSKDSAKKQSEIEKSESKNTEDPQEDPGELSEGEESDCGKLVIDADEIQSKLKTEHSDGKETHNDVGKIGDTKVDGAVENTNGSTSASSKRKLSDSQADGTPATKMKAITQSNKTPSYETRSPARSSLVKVVLPVNTGSGFHVSTLPVHDITPEFVVSVKQPTKQLQSDSNHIVSKYVEKAVHAIQQTFQDMYQDLTKSSSNHNEAFNKDSEITRLKWVHKMEIQELQHNADLTFAEIKASMEREKAQAVASVAADLKSKMESEKEKVILETKKKQWCAHCGKEAVFYCCWNTSYCDYPCQQADWPNHMTQCSQSSQASQPHTTQAGQSEITSSTSTSIQSAPIVNHTPPSVSTPPTQIHYVGLQTQPQVPHQNGPVRGPMYQPTTMAAIQNPSNHHNQIQNVMPHPGGPSMNQITGQQPTGSIIYPAPTVLPSGALTRSGRPAIRTLMAGPNRHIIMPPGMPRNNVNIQPRPY